MDNHTFLTRIQIIKYMEEVLGYDEYRDNLNRNGKTNLWCMLSDEERIEAENMFLDATEEE